MKSDLAEPLPPNEQSAIPIAAPTGAESENPPAGILGQLSRLLYDPAGPLTEKLRLSPAGFGLGKVPANAVPDSTTTMICGFCSTGCSLDVQLRGGKAVGLTPNVAYPVNLGAACPKGWEALAILNAPDRAVTPLLKNERGQQQPVDWDTALVTMVERLRDIQAKYGPQSVAFLGTGQLPTEELALFGALCKFGMGMVHGDGNTRQCMATAVVAYKESFGFDAPPYTYQDLEESDVLVFVGANVCIAHPIMWQRVMRNPHRPEIIVVDPRRTETAMAATMHLALRPKSDLDLFYGIAHILIAEGWIDRAICRRPYLGLRRIRGARGSLHSRARGGRHRNFSRCLAVGRAQNPRRPARVVLVDDGRQPKPPRRPHCAKPDQSGPDDRQHRPPRHRRQFDHRPVQRDGLATVLEHHESSRRPRFPQRRTPRSTWPACSASTSSEFPTSRVGPTTKF